MFLEQLPEQSYKGNQLGWITGFTWSRLQIIDYQKYKEVIHGSVPKDLLTVIFRKLRLSRTFNQHIWVDIFKFINLILIITAILLILVGMILYHHMSFAIGLSLLLLGYILKEFQECVGCCGSLRLKKKIRDLVQELNRELQPVGIVLRFPIRTRKVCLTFKWNLCKAVDYNTLEIWSCEEQLQILNPKQDRSTDESHSKTNKGNKLDEDQSVYV